MSLHEIIDACQTGDPDSTVAAVFDRLGCPAKWRDVFYGVVRDECRRRYRYDVRDLENGHLSGDTHDSPAAGSRTSYLAERFFTGERYVTWADATVADHEARIVFQTRLRDGITADIERHRAAIADITAAGVTCLGDLDRKAAA